MKQILFAKGEVALVDDEDFERVSLHKWHLSSLRLGRNGRRYYYAQTQLGPRSKRKTTLLHRFILGVDSTMVIDHIDGNGLNNQRANLRACSVSDNAANSFHGRGRPNESTSFKGVSFLKGDNRWMARIGDGSNHSSAYLGCFKTAEEAARAYDTEAEKRYGAFAQLNFPKVPC